MPTHADISAPAALLGDATRAAFMLALSSVQALPASELAQRAGVSASTASIQLAKLVEGGLLTVESHGRHRYYAIADPAVAAAIESLAAIAPRRQARPVAPMSVGHDLQAARTCYDHLAGVLGVAVLDALLAERVLSPELVPTKSGARRLADLGIDVDEIAQARRVFSRSCLDWSERRYHLAGALGAALTTRFFELRWIERTGPSRAVRLTPEGKRAMPHEVGATFASVASLPVWPK